MLRKPVIATCLGLLSFIACSASPVAAQQSDRENPRVQDMTAGRALDRTIIKTIAEYMHSQHLSKHPLDDEISERAFDQLLKSLDSMKIYFLQSDIDGFKANRDRLDEFAR
ncbi:MAG: hypothetical protein KDA51_11170, partial [Planctomycetales bacterium]|nr:hypothetical protein [Planctomycetales bacterium]